jgi:hypothetical protein
MIVAYLQKCKLSFCNGWGCTQLQLKLNFYCKFVQWTGPYLLKEPTSHCMCESLPKLRNNSWAFLKLETEL